MKLTQADNTLKLTTNNWIVGTIHNSLEDKTLIIQNDFDGL